MKFLKFIFYVALCIAGWYVNIVGYSYIDEHSAPGYSLVVIATVILTLYVLVSIFSFIIYAYRYLFPKVSKDKWYSCKTRAPIGQLIIFRGINFIGQEVYFIDKLTNQKETLEYGQTCYLLKDNPDYIYYEGDFDITSLSNEYVTHWKILNTLT